MIIITTRFVFKVLLILATNIITVGCSFFFGTSGKCWFIVTQDFTNIHVNNVWENNLEHQLKLSEIITVELFVAIVAKM